MRRQGPDQGSHAPPTAEGAGAGDPSAAWPLVRGENLTQVSPHVWVIPDGSVPRVPNVGFVVGGSAVLVIDTGMGPRNGETVLREALRLSAGRKLYLMTTHVHPEHDLGAGVFPASTTMLRSRAQVDEIADVGLGVADDFRAQSAAARELLRGAEFRRADIVFASELTVDLGGVEVRLIAVGPNHTPGDTVAHVVEDSLLFSGDVVMKGTPAFASAHSSLAHWLRSLDLLESLASHRIVPSHGPIGDASLLAAYRSYLGHVRDRVGEMKGRGGSVEDVTAALIPELLDQWPDAPRIAGAIRSAYAEA